MAILTVTSGPQLGKVDSLNGEALLGRSPKCDIQYTDRTVSRRHAQITSEGDEYYIVDLGSQHGTVLNGQLVKQQEKIPTGSTIGMGECQLKFEDGDAPQVPPTELSHTDDSSGTEIVDALQVMDSQRRISDQKLRAVLEIMHNVGVALDVETIFPKVLESLMNVFPNAQRACIQLVDGNGAMRVAASHVRGRPNEEPEFALSSTLVDRVLRHGKAVLSDDALNDPEWQTKSVYKLDLRSLMCSPLMNDEKVAVGLIYVDTRETHTPFQSKDLDVLITIANLAAKGLGVSQLHKARMTLERQQQDMRLAQDLQLHFLPRQMPEISGYQLATYYQAALNIGGDYLGCQALPDGRVALTVADVAGKGTSAALVMARLCSDIRYGLATHRDAADVMQWLNREMLAVDEYGRFVTMALVILDPDNHQIQIANAGHPPPLLKTQGGMRTWVREDSGPPLGVLPDSQYKQQVWDLQPSDCLLLHTDGANEVTAPSGELFGIGRVAEIFSTSNDADSAVSLLRNGVETFLDGKPQPDDVCILSIMRES